MLLSITLIHCLIKLGKAISEEDMDKLIPENYTTSRPLDRDPILFGWSLQPHVVEELSAKSMEFTVDLKVWSYWKDEELIINTKNYLNVPSDIAQRLWYPWLKFNNCKGCQSEIIDPRFDSFSIESKLVWALFRRRYTFTCILDLSNYPFDRQKCTIDVRLMVWHGLINFTHVEEDKYYENLHKNPVLVPPEFTLDSLERVFTLCPNPNFNVSDHCFRYDFVFKRISIQYILLVFLPSMLIVILSWISFWLQVDMAAPRVALGLTSLLTLSTQFNSAQRNLPAVATIKALDVWMFACLFMVFASLLVYAISYSCKRLNKLRESIPQPPNATKIIRRKPPYKIHNHHQLNLLSKIKIRRSFKVPDFDIDKGARFIFPLFFTVFNIYFWSTYI